MLTSTSLEIMLSQILPQSVTSKASETVRIEETIPRANQTVCPFISQYINQGSSSFRFTSAKKEEAIISHKR